MDVRNLASRRIFYIHVPLACWEGRGRKGSNAFLNLGCAKPKRRYLTPGTSQRSVKFVMKMRRIAVVQRQATAALVLLAILIAPLCAPLCGSRACAGSQTEDCHSSVTANGGTHETDLRTDRACALGELPTAALNETTISPEQLKQVFALPSSPQFSIADQPALIAVESALSPRDNEPPQNRLIEVAVLRI